MIKPIAYFLIVTFSLLIGSVEAQSGALTEPSSASGLLAPSPPGASVLLKLNDSYLLYSHPTPPFVSTTGHVMVPVGVVGRLLDAEVSYDFEEKAVTVTRADRSLQLTAGSDEAFLGDRSVKLSVAPRWLDEGELIVPIRGLLESFDITFSWDGATHVLTLRDANLLQDGDITSTFANRLPEGYADTTAFVPGDVRLREDAQQGGETVQATELTLTLDLMPDRKTPV